MEGCLGDDIGDQVVGDHRYLVSKPQLALLEPGDLQLVFGPAGAERVDCGIKIAMLDAEYFESFPHLVFGHA